MGDATSQFFAEKRPWSRIKDQILKSYLTPYLAKVAKTGRAVVVADCFAGKGVFDDGEPGSPTLICDAIDYQLQCRQGTKIRAVFIENQYSGELARALGQRNYTRILDGDYRTRIENFITRHPAENANLFLYVDPYGIKSLRMEDFRRICQIPLHSVELLINFNAHGFLREACRLLKPKLVAGMPPTEKYEPDVSSPQMLDEIAGGRYWRDIVEQYYRERDLSRAEESLTKQYTTRLHDLFKYAIQIPVRVKLHHMAKYRMVFGTNHEDGLLLMADNMNKRWDEFRQSARKQNLLFEVDYPDRNIELSADARRIAIREMVACRTDLKTLLVKLIETFGVCFSTSEYKTVLKDMEKRNEIVITREPALTSSGQERTGWDYKSRDYQVYVEKGGQGWQPDLL